MAFPLLTTYYSPLTRSSLTHSLSTSRAQSAIEYAVTITVLVAALVGMSLYVKRALSGKWRQVGDSFGSGRQYDPCVTSIDGGPPEKTC